uniref:Uncharacterized protein n=1 Tax=Rhizophora mucronata TaxID=61149 RepID=A0A2P2NBZ6_RHIMU
MEPALINPHGISVFSLHKTHLSLLL